MITYGLNSTFFIYVCMNCKERTDKQIQSHLYKIQHNGTQQVVLSVLVVAVLDKFVIYVLWYVLGLVSLLSLDAYLECRDNFPHPSMFCHFEWTMVRSPVHLMTFHVALAAHLLCVYTRLEVCAPTMTGSGGDFKPCEVDEIDETAQNYSNIYESDVEDDENDMPSHVNTIEQLIFCPSKYRSDDPLRPLKLQDQCGETYKYALNPTRFSVLFILLVELLERFSFYGVGYTQTAFLTGAYNKLWNVGMTSIEASSCVSRSTAMAYSSPLIGALLADCLLGDYWVILLGLLVLYIPGLLTIVLTTVPNFLGNEFPRTTLRFAILFLWPLGAGTIKSVVNIFGARQFHPKLQASMIESYYVNFYMCINVGSLIGGILIPIIAQLNVSVAYSIPLGALAFGVILFIAFTQRYVRRRPQGDFKSSVSALYALLRIMIGKCTIHNANEDQQKLHFKNLSKGATTIVFPPDASHVAAVTSARHLMNVIYISFLTVAFNVAYSQMATVFIVQGTVMNTAAGFIDAALMNNADAISVLLSGFIVGNFLYPLLARHKLKIYTTYKFAVGSFFGSLAIFWALIVEYRIHSVYAKTGEKISILWQAFAYIFIGTGEIFAISTAYEIAFAIAPKQQKALSSAINLFFTGGVPNFICLGLYRACQRWFINSRGDANINSIQDYSQARVVNYFWVLLFISLIGMVVNLLPSVRDWVASVEEEADLISTSAAIVRNDLETVTLDRTLTELTSNSVEFDFVQETENSALLTVSLPQSQIHPVSSTFSPPSKTVLKAKKFVLLNRHASQYGSLNKK